MKKDIKLWFLILLLIICFALLVYLTILMSQGKSNECAPMNSNIAIIIALMLFFGYMVIKDIPRIMKWKKIPKWIRIIIIVIMIGLILLCLILFILKITGKI